MLHLLRREGGAVFIGTALDGTNPEATFDYQVLVTEIGAEPGNAYCEVAVTDRYGECQRHVLTTARNSVRLTQEFVLSLLEVRVEAGLNDMRVFALLGFRCPKNYLILRDDACQTTRRAA